MEWPLHFLLFKNSTFPLDFKGNSEGFICIDYLKIGIIYLDIFAN